MPQENEYAKLSKEQKAELRAWRAASQHGKTHKPDGKGKGKVIWRQNDKLLSKKQVAAISRQVAENISQGKWDNQKDSDEAYIHSLVKKALEQESVEPETPSTTTTTPTVKSILKRIRNAKKK